MQAVDLMEEHEGRDISLEESTKHRFRSREVVYN